MTRTYTINSSYGFIGFCLIYGNQQFKQGTLTLFETVSFGNQTMMYQQASKHQIYYSTMTDIDIVRNLITQQIPSFGTNGLTYLAIDCNGNSQTV